MEKQKVIFHYGLRENQLRNYVSKTKKIKSGSWVDHLIENLEKRLDSVVFRANFAPSMLSARQMVKHGHILVNGKKVDVPGQVLKVGDIVEMTPKGISSGYYLQAKVRPRMESPAFLRKEAAGEGEKAEVIADPLPGDIPFEFQKQLLIEYYWKV